MSCKYTINSYNGLIVFVIESDDLRNECLPEKTHPSTYDFELYRAILHPRGMTSLDCSLADLHMCSKCRGALIKSPVLLKDTVANYGRSLGDPRRCKRCYITHCKSVWGDACGTLSRSGCYHTSPVQILSSLEVRFKTAYKFAEAIVSQKQDQRWPRNTS